MKTLEICVQKEKSRSKLNVAYVKRHEGLCVGVPERTGFLGEGQVTPVCRRKRLDYVLVSFAQL